jgi:hypothetical protein
MTCPPVYHTGDDMDDLCDDINETLEKIECLITLVPYLDGSVDETRLTAIIVAIIGDYTKQLRSLLTTLASQRGIDR